MTRLFAQPYDISATGFYFDTSEEYEIQFIDGEEIDCALFKALGVHQGNFGQYLDACDEWSEDDKRKVIIAVGEAGYRFDLGNDNPDSLDVDLYELDSLL